MTDITRTAEQLYWNNTTAKAEQSQCIPYYRHDTELRSNNKDLFRDLCLYKTENMIDLTDCWENHLFSINITDEIIYYRAYNRRKMGNIKGELYTDIINKHWIEPMLIFVDNKLIPFSKMKLYDDGKEIHLLMELKNYDSMQDNYPEKLDILHLPFEITYTEKNEIYEDRQLLFIFDKLGNHSYDDPSIRIYINKGDNYWYREGTSALGSVIRYDLDIDDEYHIYPSNVIVFKNGLLYREADVKIDNYNALYIDRGEPVGLDKITYKIYRDLTTDIEFRNIDMISNHDYLKHLEYENEKEEAIKTLSTKYDYEFDPELSYDENIKKFIEFSKEYNYRLFLNKLRSSNMKYNRVSVDIIRNLVDENGYINIPYAPSMRSNCFPLIFIDGLLSNKYIKKRNRSGFILDFGSIPEDSKELEILYFKSYRYTPALSFVYTEVNVPNYVYIENNLEISILSHYHPDKCFEMDDESKCFYTVDQENYTYSNNILTFLNDKYANQELVIVPKRKVCYERFTMPTNNYRVILGTQFNYSNREDHYTVYINGRKINSSLYRVIVPSPVRPFNERAVYFHTMLKTGDIVEVLYSSITTVSEVYLNDLDHSSETDAGIDELGYIKAPKDYPIPLSDDIQMYFVNGKKLNPFDLKPISFDTIRICKDIKTVEDLCITSFDDDFVEYIKDLNLSKSVLDDVYGYFTKSEINSLTDTYAYISNAELVRKTDFSKEAIIHQIIKDYYTHVNKGVPFRYTYDKDTYTEVDSNGNIILDVIDGTVYKSLEIKEADDV